MLLRTSTIEVVVPSTRATAVLAVLACSVPLALPALSHAAASPGAQEVVSVKRYTLGRVAPNHGARGVTHLWTNTGFSNRRAIHPVVERRSVGGSEWVRIKAVKHRRQVLVWIPAWVTRKKTVAWNVVVDISQRRATVTRAGRVVRRFRVVVGTSRTPTPPGDYFVIDHMRLRDSWAGGTWALALSAFSSVHKTFAGGIGQIAMHGRGSLAAPLGTAASNGCIRFGNDSITWMARRVPNGTPVQIRR